MGIMNKRFWMTTIFAALLVGVTLAIGACAPEPTPEPPKPTAYTVTFDANGGTFADGSSRKELIALLGKAIAQPESPVKTGFTLESWTTAAGAAYDFAEAVNSDFTLTAKWQTARYTIAFETVNGVTVEYDGGEEVAAGTSVTFSLSVGALYAGTPEVKANGTAVAPNADGTYTVVVQSDTVVKVDGVYGDVSAMKGRGTVASPYQVARPVDLVYMADRINAADENYTSACFVLVGDLDFGGVAIKVIGDGKKSGAAFSGSFDGNGKTIRNFRIETDDTHFVGLFGQVIANVSDDYTATISNLTLEDYAIDASVAGMSDGPAVNKLLTVGSFVGYGIGANVYACEARGGVIDVVADAYVFSYVGGVFGIQQSAYSAAYELRCFSSATYVTSDVSINVLDGLVAGAGGITGMLLADEDRTPAYIANSYSSAAVAGATRSGGIVGYQGNFTSVINCYATGDINAQTFFDNEELYQEYVYAFAGGIVGFAECDTIVADSFAASSVRASAALGDKYAASDEIAGGSFKSGYPQISSEEIVLRNNWYAEGGTDGDVSLADPEWVKSHLGWKDADWVFETGRFPLIRYEDAENEFTVTVAFGTEKVDGAAARAVEIDSRYLPMAAWYLTPGGIAEFVSADSGLRSFGFYFDEELAERVPYGFVPTRDVTLYAGWADYADVAGEYYVTEGRPRAISLVLDANGTVTFADGAMTYEFDYVYNGEYLLFRDATFARLVSDDTIDGTAELYDFYGKIKPNGAIEIYDGKFFAEDEPLVAGKSKGVYGTYFNAANTAERYAFYENFTGVYGKDGREYTFTYALTANDGFVITLDFDTKQVTGTFADGGIRIGETVFAQIDRFVGTWDNFGSEHRSYDFDGVGKYNYAYYGYRYSRDAAGKQRSERYVIEEGAGTYEIDEHGAAVLSNGVQARFEDGFLVVTEDGTDEQYSRQFGYNGHWVDEMFGVDLWLYGLNEYGVGNAIVQYADGSAYSLTYAVNEEDRIEDAKGETYEMVTLYSGAQMYGWVIYNADGNLLSAALYYPAQGMIVDNFELARIDEYEGKWIGETFFDELDFNGFGLYDWNVELSDGSQWVIEGTVTVNGEEVRYYLENATTKGYFEYKGSRYDIAYNANGTVTVTEEGECATFERADTFGGLTMLDGSGVRYTFDGRGNLSAGGTVTVSGGGSNTAYGYKIVGENMDLYQDGEIIGSMKPSADGKVYVFAVEGAEPARLTYGNYFTGEWALSGYMNTLVIGELAIDYTIEGTFLGEPVTFSYIHEGLMSFPTEMGKLYVIALEDGSVAVSGYSDLNHRDYILCAAIDDLYGEWTGADGNMKFDGVGESSYTYGFAKFEGKDGDTVNYAYVLDVFGEYIVWTSDAEGQVSQYRFARCAAADEGAFTQDGVSRKLIAIDALYRLEATDEDGNVYAFDGEGKGTVNGKDAFSYEVVTADDITKTCTVRITKNGATVTAVVDSSDEDNITIALEE